MAVSTASPFGIKRGSLPIGPLDAGPLDAGPLDAGPLDAGRLDAGRAVLLWATGAAGLVGVAGFATWGSPRFGFDHAVIDMPVWALVLGLCGAGLVFALTLPTLVHRSQALSGAPARIVLGLMIAGGLAARLVLLPSEPMLEDDYQRYLWDGGVTAAGLNPYAVAPKTARQMATSLPTGGPLGTLAQRSGDVVDRIGHAQLRTIYPPVAQAAFAAAHWLAPWSLVAWRSLLLACDLAVLALLLALMREAGLPLLAAALYWWNPLVIKELFNSAHLEPVVMVPVLLALLLAVRQRPISAAIALAVATGAKLWPILLLPLILRPLVGDWRRLLAAFALVAVLLGLWAWPILRGGLDDTSGFVVYATKWQTNSAHFPVLEHGLGRLSAGLGAPTEWGGRLLRLALAGLAGGLALWLARSPATGAQELLQRAGILTAALLFLSPAQYPWYAIWFLPLLPFLPLRCFLVLTVTLPLYYAFFHFNARGHPAVFGNGIVWAIWIPAWMALWHDLRAGRGFSIAAQPTTPIDHQETGTLRPVP